MPKTNIWPNIILLLVTILICFIFIEFFLRIAFPQQLELTTADAEKLSHQIYIKDDILSHALKPNTQTRYLQPLGDFNSSIKINADGFNGDKLDTKKPRSTIRILCLGDSQTFGHGVDYNQTYCYNLKELLKDKFPYIIETMNVGVPSYAADQEYLSLKQLMKYDPDIILLLFVANDIEDLEYHNLTYDNNNKLTKVDNIAYYVDKNNRLRLSWKRYSYGVNPFIFRTNEFLSSNLHSFVLFKNAFRNILIPLFVDKKRSESIKSPISKGLTETQEKNFNKT
jgi:lysophospholipase L1-like esterase